MLPDTEGGKTCRDCNRTKPIDEFYRHASYKDGRSPFCRSCTVAKSRKRGRPPKVRRFKNRYRDEREVAAEEAVRVARVNEDAFARLRADREAVAGGARG